VSDVSRRFHIAIACALLVAVAVPASASASASGAHRRAVRAKLLRQIKRHPGLIRSRTFIKKASAVNFILPVTIRLNPDVVLPNVLCGAFGLTAGCAGPVTLPQLGGLQNSDDQAILNLGASFGIKNLKIGGQVEAYVDFKSPLDGGNIGDVDIVFKDSVASPMLQANPISILTNPDVTTKPVAQGGCTDRGNNATSLYRGGQFGAVPGPLNFGSGTATPGVTSADKIAADADNPENMPFMNTPAIGPDGNPNVRQNTVLRVGGPVTPDNPMGNLGVGINATKSGGTANVLGMGPSQVKLALEIRTYSIYRYNVDAARGNGIYQDTPGAFDFFDVYDYNCRQSWTGYFDNKLNAVVGGGKNSLRISPAFTLDRHLRIAKIDFDSTGVTTHNEVAACLQPYTTFVNYGTQAQSFNWDHFTTGDISDDYPLPIFAQITDELDQDRSAIGPAPGTISGIPLNDDSFNAGIAQCDEYPYVNGVYPDVTGNLGEPWNTTGAGETPLVFLGPVPSEPDYAQPPYLLHRLQCGELVPGGPCEQSDAGNDVANKARLDADLTVQHLTGEVLIGHGIPALATP
jgi:hypothetical protein